MSDFDGPWKAAVERFFRQFMLLLFPLAYAEIDWERGHESLDKELQTLFPDGETGRLSVDLLFKVWLKTGEENWILIHIEIQSQQQPEFPARMFGYQYRGYDRYKRPVASFAVLADTSPAWHPTSFGYNALGSQVYFEFPTAKLLDYPEDWLQQQSNPVAMLVLAHRKAQETHGRHSERSVWKLRLIRGLIDSGLAPDEARELLRLIDWMIDLPADLEDQLWQDIEAIKKEKHMEQHIMWPERKARAEGRVEGRIEEGRELIELTATAKFGAAVAADLLTHLGQWPTLELLRKTQIALATAGSVEDLHQLLADNSAKA